MDNSEVGSESERVVAVSIYESDFSVEETLETQNPCAVFVAHDQGYTNFSGCESCVEVQELLRRHPVSLARTVLRIHVLKAQAAAFF